MIKVYRDVFGWMIEESKNYPLYDLVKKSQSYKECKEVEVEVTEEFYTEYKKVMINFYELQDKLGEL